MGLEEHERREWVRRGATGKASRRHFLRTLLGLGLSGPVIADLLATYTPAATQGMREAQRAFTPTRRGGGRKLRLLSWQSPTILNPHLAVATRDSNASCVVYEPLFFVDPDGDFIPILAAEVSSFENGGRARDGTWTTWHLKQGVVWHDGRPFTADDVIFTWEYATDPATAAATNSNYAPIRRIDKLNDHTIMVIFTEPTPLWYTPRGQMILPKHLFTAYTGTNARH